MSLKITNNSLFAKHFLTVDSDGLKFYNSGLFGQRRFRFNQIETVLLSPAHVLSFQVGNEIFSIPTKPDDQKHRNAIDFLLQEVRRTTQ
ncbi:MAG TPA: hypothetical protein VN761_06270 [Candidatus Polarisedimenticolia bacterium]|nr:hypothetical protein [Candidatus Polarisedimenticolia bacterium]